MPRVLTVFLCAMAAACSSARVAAPKPDRTAAARLAAADALVRAGCLDCLLEAHAGYLALRGIDAVAEAVNSGAIRTAVLLAVRERELGTEDTGYLARARDLLTGATPALQQALTPLVEIADTLPVRGAARQVADDVELARMQTANRNREAWTGQLGAHADDDPLSAYLWLAFNCAYVPASQHAVEHWLSLLTAGGTVPPRRRERHTPGTGSARSGRSTRYVHDHHE